MRRDHVFQKIEPVDGQLGEHLALARNTVGQDHVEGGNAVRGDEENIFAGLINVANFSARNELDTGEVAFKEDGSFSFGHGSLFA